MELRHISSNYNFTIVHIFQTAILLKGNASRRTIELLIKNKFFMEAVLLLLICTSSLISTR
jgi:hypothetical protein